MGDTTWQEVFGPDPEPSEVKTSKTNYPRVQPPPVRDVCDAYERLIRKHGFTGRIGKSLRKGIIAGARDWHEEYGVNAALMERALKKALDIGSIIKSPRSLITFAAQEQWKKDDGVAPPIAKGDWI